jgi:hypothetical protein
MSFITVELGDSDVVRHQHFCRYRMNFLTRTIIKVNESGRVLKPEIYDWLIQNSGEEVVVFRLLDRMFYHDISAPAPQGIDKINEAEFKDRLPLMAQYNPIIDRRNTWALPHRDRIMFQSPEMATLFKLTWL